MNASSIFYHLQESALLKDDVTTLVSQGTTLFLAGDTSNALLSLQRV